MLNDFFIQEKKPRLVFLHNCFNLLLHHCEYNEITLPYCSLTVYSSESVNNFDEENLTDDEYEPSFDVSLRYSKVEFSDGEL